MARFYGVLLIIALVAVSGVIAYVGDIVGRRMGRKRLTLFGMRPRHTAIAISVVAGMLITMFTLAAAMLVSPNVRSGFLHVEQMRKQQRDLQLKANDLQKQRIRLERDVKAADDLVQARKRDLQTAHDTLTRTQSDLGATQKDLKQARTDLEKRQAELAQAQADLKQRQTELTAAKAAIANATQMLATARVKYAEAIQDKIALEGQVTRAAGEIAVERTAPVLVGASQPLDAEVVQGGQPKPAIRAQLNRFLGRLDQKARAAGARPTGGKGDAVVVGKAVYDPDKRATAWFNRDQVLDAICDKIHGESGSIIVRARSMINTYVGEPIFVDLELYNNRLVFRKGDVLARATLYGQESQPALLGKLVGLLKYDVGKKALAKNMMPRSSASSTDPFGSTGSAVGEMTYEELLDKVDEIKKLGGAARVTVVAADDAWTIGPLKVAMRVERGD